MLTFEFSDIAFDDTADPRAEIAQGNYETAAMLAGRADDEELAATAVLMAGAIRQGLERLAKLTPRHPETHLYAAFGHWCLGAREAALASLDAVSAQELATLRDGLRALIQRPSFAVTVVADPNNARGAALNPGDGFTIRHIATKAERDSLLASSERLGDDLLLIYDSQTPALIERAARDGVPSAVLTTDFDQRWSELFDVLGRTDVIIGATRLEHYILSKIYDTRVVSFPALTIREHRGAIHAPDAHKDIDIFFSGLAFAPHWPDKARMLYRIAGIDNPDLKIHINHGYLDEAAYRNAMRRTRFVPLSMRFGTSANQDRTTEVLHYGTCGIVTDGVPAHWILGDAGRRLASADLGQIADEVPAIIADYDRRIASVGTERFAELIADFYAPSPERDAKTLKFILFQTLFKMPRTRPRRAIRNDATRTRLAADSAARFADFAFDPLAPERRQAALNAFDREIAQHPDAIAPRFNKARALWMMGRRADAVALFAAVAEMPAAAEICHPGDTVLAHRFRALSSMMPYYAYYQGMVLDCADDDERFPRAHAVIVATALTYLALDHSQNRRFAEGAECAARALALCGRHHPAAWQLTKAAAAAGLPPERILRAYLAAVELFPPLIDELLPFGVQAMERMGFTDLAEYTVRTWLYSVLRISYSEGERPAIAADAYECAVRYFSRLPDQLKAIVKDGIQKYIKNL